jgi:uncharacterized protein
MLVEAEIWSIARIGQDNAILIRPIDGDVAVPIYIDQYQTQAILIGLGNVKMPRPLTHDLLLSILETLSISIERVEITSLTDGTYFAQLVMDKTGEKITIDARPSDSIALAVRLQCPIYIDDSVVEEAGREISKLGTGEDIDITEGYEENPQSQEKNQRKTLEDRLQKAVGEENYEEATVLRDLLKELEKKES